MEQTLYTADQIRNATSIKVAAGMIRQNLVLSQYWLGRGLLAIYNRQTAEEQNMEATICDNKIGFSGVDAKLLTSFAKQFSDRKSLSPKQWSICQRQMLKYSTQLARIARATPTKADIQRELSLA